MLLTLLSLVTLFSQVISAQVVVNGQIFTNGLAIIDSPAPNTSLHAGSTAAIAVDVSGDGHLSLSADSHVPTHFISLEIYLTSADLNVTVSQGPDLLKQEQGSTVKHISWAVDACVPSGNYNLTFYEGSIIQDRSYFIVTPLPVSVQNFNPTSLCQNNTNPPQPIPQPSSSLTKSPWLDETQTSLAPVPFPSNTVSEAFGLHTLFSLGEVVMFGAAVAYLMYWV
ncbi:hypothetical protein BXZ70DRAFT_916315 [Cristinia sonorae]|uniref:Uncharacterized protein n=1 Tax=Cristinia sonorae TaxID=1940300 RepID=A0A8K0XUC4_9AGAR|nr:hypothetical protein BXZ70DRAFT_916315 [Cristinia sonorae]